MSDEKRYADGWLVDPRDHLAEPMWKEFCGEHEDREFGDLQPWERDEFRAMVRIAQDYYDPKIASLEADLELLRQFSHLHNLYMGRLQDIESVSFSGSEEKVRQLRDLLTQDLLRIEEFWSEHAADLARVFRGRT